jgi:NAD(P)-dependent dehydrogenase (short-subunit alcohol dehydrogenase family)
MSYNDLKGKTFIVTGAASGMGRTTSLWLTKQGANVGLLDLQKPDNTLSEIEALGGKALSIACNVQDSKIMEDSVEVVADHFGRLDGAANMAGYVGNQGLSGKGFAMDVIEDDDWNNMIATNLNGVKNSIRAELRHMTGKGSIVNAASIAGLYGFPWNAPYVAAKWGVIGMTKSTAQEVGVRGIRVNAVAP